MAELRQKRVRCTWCGRLVPRAASMPDPQHRTPICKDRLLCNATVDGARQRKERRR